MISSEPTIRINVPTVLTLSRVFLIPFFLYVAPDHPLLGASIFLLASLTDFLDGYLARKMNSVTKFGIIVDPIADKFLVISALLLLVSLNRLEVWIAAVLIIREFLVTALRVVALSKGIIISAERGGKLKTAAQFIGIVALVLEGRLLGVDLFDLGLLFIWIALVLSVVSGVQYTVTFWKKL
jgi:CDP-diacylglycerol--glycerol-3-phosphate 3-phosphatidyltransferase